MTEFLGDPEEEENEDAPRCEDCSTLLTDYKDSNPHFSGFGWGCPECCEPYCPFCFVKLHGSPKCDHLIFDGVSEEGGEANPFDKAAFDAAVGDHSVKLNAFSEGQGWTAGQEEEAFGPLLSAYAAFTKERHISECDAVVALLEALPLVTEGRRVSYMWESPFSGGYFYAKGFFCDKPEVAQSYYREQAAKFVAGLNALAHMEPEETTVS